MIRTTIYQTDSSYVLNINSKNSPIKQGVRSACTVLLVNFVFYNYERQSVEIHKILPTDISDIGVLARGAGYTAGVVKKENRLIVLLNIAKIIQDVNPEIVIGGIDE